MLVTGTLLNYPVERCILPELKSSLFSPYLCFDINAACENYCLHCILTADEYERGSLMPCGKKKKRRKIATHKRKKKRRENRHKKR